MKRQVGQIIAGAAALSALSLLLVSCAGNPEKAKLEYLKKGDAYMTQKKYSSAVIEYRNALKVDPRYTDAYFQLAKADMAQANIDYGANKTDATIEDLKGAYGAIGQAISLDPTRVDLRIARAVMIVKYDPHNYPQASDDLNYVLKQDPKNADAYRGLGTLFMKQNQYDQALQEFSKAAAIDPKDATSQVYMGVANLKLLHPDDAELNFKKAIEIDPHAGPAYVELAELYLQQKNPAQAEQTLSSGISALPSADGLYVALAEIYVQQKEFAQAEQTLQSGIKANSTAIPLYLQLATLLKDEGKHSDAVNTLTSLLDQMPKSVDAAVAAGSFYTSGNMNDLAVDVYQQALARNPGNLILEQHLEDVYLNEGQTDQAAALDADMLKQSPNDVLARTDQGRLLMAQGKVSDAVNTLQIVSSQAAASPEAHYYLAMAYLQSNNPAQANSELQQALAQANNAKTVDASNIARLALGRLVQLNLGQGKYSVAQLYAQELVKDTPASPLAHMLLGDALWNLGQAKNAEQEYTTAQKLAPTDPSVEASVAMFYARERKLPEAESQLKSAMQASPSSLAVLNAYADVLVSEKKTQQANALASQFVTKNPNDAGGHFVMARLYLLDKNDAGALSETKECLRLDPKNVDAYLQLGQIYQNQGNNAAAVQAYLQGSQLSPSSAPILTKIGDLYSSEGNVSNAIEEYQKALNIDPTFAIAANNLAWVYAEQGQNLDVALGLAQKAKAEEPNAPSISDTLAWVMFRKGDYAGAVPLLQECIRKVPNDAQFHYHLGMALVSDGKKSAGKTELQAALQMKLDSQDAAQARKALSQ
jgi:cellulose synthase operon protein C